MSGLLDSRGPMTTFLTHLFDGGLIDKGECYVLNHFRAISNAAIRRWPGAAPTKNNGRRPPTPEVASVDAVQELRPAYNEIIVWNASVRSSANAESKRATRATLWPSTSS